MPVSVMTDVMVLTSSRVLHFSVLVLCIVIVTDCVCELAPSFCTGVLT